MKKIKILGLLIAISNLSLAEETVLVPLENGLYKRVPISEVMPKENELKLKEIEKEKILKAKAEDMYVYENLIEMRNPSILEDLLKISINYDYKEFDKKSIKDNRNPIENRVISDFLHNSKMNVKITEDLYLFNIDTFGIKSKFENFNNEYLENTGFIASIQYGINDNMNIKLNSGYSKSKFLNEKSNNLYFSLDYSYFQYGDYDWEIGVNLGYFNGENTYYRSEDMFIGMIYSNISIPLTESIELDGNYETTILSNKLGLGLTKNIYYFDNFDLSLGVFSNYIFEYTDKEKKIYTHLDEKEPSIEVNMEISTEQSRMNMYYDFQYESAGIKLEYKF